MHTTEPAPRTVQGETARLGALRGYEVLDSAPEGAFDDITELASYICATPIAVVNFIDAERQWFKSEIGLGVRETPLAPSICVHAILQEDLFVVRDTTLDTRFARNPLVTGDPGLRFYAGAPLITSEGHAIGTVCVLDVQPRDLTAAQLQALKALARQTMAQLELRKALVAEQRQAKFRSQFMAAMGHDLKTPLRTIGYSLEKLKRRDAPDFESRLAGAAAALAQIDRDFTRLAALAVADSASARVAKSWIVLADVLDPLVATWRGTAARKGISLDYVRSERRVFSHPELLATIIGNLLSNAIKHTSGPGRVLLGSRRGASVERVMVIDQGAGIDPAFQHEIFDAFRQADSMKEGLGLGLWIVSRTAALLEHRVSAASTLRSGSMFSIEISAPVTSSS